MLRPGYYFQCQIDLQPYGGEVVALYRVKKCRFFGKVPAAY